MKTEATKNGRDRVRRIKLAVLLLTCGVCVYAFAIFPKTTTATEPAAPTPPAPQELDYSKFLHSSAQHTRMPCLLCHKRDDNSAALKFSGHLPCSGCHVQQFANQSSQICTVCHTSGAALKRFPGIRSFNIQFDHGRHQYQAKCATCHTTSRGGVALTVPSGPMAHSTCFQCHSPKAQAGGRDIGSCSTCHAPGRPVRGSAAARAFSLNFSHQEHLNKGLNCASCHNIRPGALRGRQVASPLAAMHAAPAGTRSCASCHNNTRAFGIGNFADCKKCHEGKTFKF